MAKRLIQAASFHYINSEAFTGTFVSQVEDESVDAVMDVIPGEIFTAPGVVEMNVGRVKKLINVTSLCDRPIQVV